MVVRFVTGSLRRGSNRTPTLADHCGHGAAKGGGSGGLPPGIPESVNLGVTYGQASGARNVASLAVSFQTLGPFVGVGRKAEVKAGHGEHPLNMLAIIPTSKRIAGGSTIARQHIWNALKCSCAPHCGHLVALRSTGFPHVLHCTERLLCGKGAVVGAGGALSAIGSGGGETRVSSLNTLGGTALALRTAPHFGHLILPPSSGSPTVALHFGQRATASPPNALGRETSDIGCQHVTCVPCRGDLSTAFPGANRRFMVRTGWFYGCGKGAGMGTVATRYTGDF